MEVGVGVEKLPDRKLPKIKVKLCNSLNLCKYRKYQRDIKPP